MTPTLIDRIDVTEDEVNAICTVLNLMDRAIAEKTENKEEQETHYLLVWMREDLQRLYEVLL